MHKEAREELRVGLKLIIFELASVMGVSEACREFDVPRSIFYIWKRKYDAEGRSGLYKKKPIAYCHPRKKSSDVIEKILELRTDYQLGALRIVYYLACYHGIKISESTVSRVLKAHGVNKLPKSAPRRSIHSKRYAKKGARTPGTARCKCRAVEGQSGKVNTEVPICGHRQYHAYRALQIYPQHNQDCAVRFVDYVIEKFPFRIAMVRTDRDHEFQARFHCHIEDLGIQHVYIKPRTPQLNGKVERSHRTDEAEFYQLLTYTDDIDLHSKLKAWEDFYNYDRPHISLRGKTPNEVY